MKLYDCIVIGGGPAGLSAAIYLARFNRSVMVVDSGDGRWQSREINENFLGFPEGIAARTLVMKGRLQAEKFGAEFLQANISQLKKENDLFHLVTESNEGLQARTILLATGVKDRWPKFEHQVECLGISLFWCITCDGFKTINKKISVIGQDDDSVVSALQFLEFTKKINFFTDAEKDNHQITNSKLELLKKYQIPFQEGKIKQIQSEDGYISQIETVDGVVAQTEMIFSHFGATPNSQLARELEVNCNEEGYVLVDKEQRTSIIGVYAAGDLTERYGHQIVTAAHEGAQAAQAINYNLYSDDQRH